MSKYKNWGHSIKPQEQQILMQSFISTVTSSGLQGINTLGESLSQIDKTLSKMYAADCYDPNLLYYQAVSNSYTPLQKLSLPQGNTLTDALIKNTLGCDQKYAKQYMQLLGQTEQQMQKKKRIEQIKNKFTQSNTFIDVQANSKPFVPKNVRQNSRPVVDNEHQSYLKTQLILMEKPNNPKITQKMYYEKHYGTITQQIQQLGGIQDTLSKMETTLKNHQITNLKNRSLIKQQPSLNTSNNFPQTIPSANHTSQTYNENWLEKSKKLRQQLLSKIHK